MLRAQDHHHSALPIPTQAKPYTFVWLNKEQRETVRLLMSRIIPADERSPGALGAKVDEYIDFVLSHADAAVRNTWKQGLGDYRDGTEGKSDSEVDRFLENQARNEFSPTNDHETFFVILKAVVAEGFYTSEVGINQELGYKGISFLLDFPGCTHTTHRAPDNWHPILRQPKDA